MRFGTSWTGTAAVWIAAGWLAATAAAGDETRGPDKVLERVAAYRFGENRAPLVALEGQVRAALGDPAARTALSRRMADLLGAEGTTPDGKRFLCRQLALAGGDEAVPALARLLEDGSLSHMARFALERIPGEAAGRALSEAARSLRGTLRIGALNSLGERRDPAAVEVLAEALADEDIAVSTAAAEALGKIGGDRAREALEAALDTTNAALRFAVAESCLACADRLAANGQRDRALAIYRRLHVPGAPLAIARAAFVGLVRYGPDGADRIVEALRAGHPEVAGAAAGLVRERFSGSPAIELLVALCADLPPSRRALLVRALGDRGDSEARPAAVAALASEDERVRLAGLEALGSLGKAADVPALAEAAANHSEKSEPGRAARRSLFRLADGATDAAIVSAMRGANPAVAVVLIEAMEARRIAGCGPLLIGAARHEDRKVRGAAIEALGRLAVPSDHTAFVLLVVTSPERDRKAAHSALVAALRRVEDESARLAPVFALLNGADPPTRASLAPVLARLGGDRALAEVRADLESADASLREATVRALSDWVDASPVEDLLAIARKSDVESHQVLALRGYARMLGMKSRRSTGETVAMYREGLAACRRAPERKLMISGLGKLADLGAMRLVHAQLGDPELRDEVQAAVVALAEDLVRARSAGTRKAALGILDEVAPGLTNEKLAKRADRVARKLRLSVAEEV